MTPRLVVVAKLGKSHGLKGALRLYALTEVPNTILQFKHWFLRKPRAAFVPITPLSIVPQGDHFLIQLSSINDCDAARAYVHAELAVPRSDFPVLPSETYYQADLEGLSVVTSAGVSLGTVVGFLETGVHDVLEVRGPGAHYLIPCVSRILLSVDQSAGQITVDWQVDWTA